MTSVEVISYSMLVSSLTVTEPPLVNVWPPTVIVPSVTSLLGTTLTVNDDPDGTMPEA